MFLSDIFNKPVVTQKSQRGTCLGVGISLKNQAVKYLLCSSNSLAFSNGVSSGTSIAAADFSVNVSAVEDIGEQIFLTRLRPVFPKNCAKLFIGLPIYSYEGVFLGTLTDVELDDFVATRIFTDGACYPAASIFACSDAVILRKEQPFPIGQRIPAPLLFDFSSQASIVTKPILKEAAKQGKLIRFTLSLPPFYLQADVTEEKKRKIF